MLEASCLADGRSADACRLAALEFRSSCAVGIGAIHDWLAMAEVAPPRPFQRGDSNRDGSVGISDVVNTLNGIFLGEGGAFEVRCLDRVDANDDGAADISDAIYTLLWLFGGRPPPPAPGPSTRGQDPTFDLELCFEGS